MQVLIDQLERADIGTVERDAPLAAHTSYRVGGPARVLVRPHSVEGLQRCRRLLREHAVTVAVIGWGSNLVVSDGGFDGVVIKLGEGLRYVRIPESSEALGGGTEVEVVVGAATMNNRLVQTLHRAGLCGAEAIALVPGTFGGAVAMNAGTKAGEVADFVRSIRVVGPDGSLADLSHEALGFRYRHADIPTGGIVAEATIVARAGDVNEARERVKAEREYRNRTQPYSASSAGSVFKNPAGDYAGRLIEAAGLKETRVGGAQISALHANFIVTEAGASAADVVGLMALAQARVKTQFGVVLEAEQRLLGFGAAGCEEVLRTVGRDRLAEVGICIEEAS